MVAQKFDQMLADQFTFIQRICSWQQLYPLLKRFSSDYNIPELIARFSINLYVPVGMLSGTNARILAILMALQKPTSVLLLDEPTAALDDKNGSMVMAFLNELLRSNKDLTVLIICHDIELVEEYARTQYYYIDVAHDDTRTITHKKV